MEDVYDRMCQRAPGWNWSLLTKEDIEFLCIEGNKHPETRYGPNPLFSQLQAMIENLDILSVEARKKLLAIRR